MAAAGPEGGAAGPPPQAPGEPRGCGGAEQARRQPAGWEGKAGDPAPAAPRGEEGVARGDPGPRKSPPARPPGEALALRIRGPSANTEFLSVPAGDAEDSPPPVPSVTAVKGQVCVCVVLGLPGPARALRGSGGRSPLSSLLGFPPPARQPSSQVGVRGRSMGCGPQRRGQDLEEVLPLSPSLEENLAYLHPVSLPFLL